MGLFYHSLMNENMSTTIMNEDYNIMELDVVYEVKMSDNAHIEIRVPHGEVEVQYVPKLECWCIQPIIMMSI